MAAVLKISESGALDEGRLCLYVPYMFSSQLLVAWLVVHLLPCCWPMLGRNNTARLLRWLGRFLGGNGMRDPGPVAAAVIRANHLYPAGVKPQRDRAAPPIVDPVDDRDLLTARKPGRRLADDRIGRVAAGGQAALFGDDGDGLAARGVAAPAVAAVQHVDRFTWVGPGQQIAPGLLGEEAFRDPLVIAAEHVIVSAGRAGGDKAAEIGDDDIGRPGEEHRRHPSNDPHSAPIPPFALPQAQPQPAEHRKHQPPDRQARRLPDIAGDRRDMLGASIIYSDYLSIS
jgi:hypothetical protein